MGQVNVNNPGGNRSSDDEGGLLAGMGLGLILGLIVILVLLLVGYFVIWPMFAAGPPAPSVNVNVRSSGLVEPLSLVI